MQEYQYTGPYARYYFSYEGRSFEAVPGGVQSFVTPPDANWVLASPLPPSPPPAPSGDWWSSLPAAEQQEIQDLENQGFNVSPPTQENG